MSYELNKILLKFFLIGGNKSIDESMIPYYATNGSRQRISNKPIRVGYNIWVLTETYDYVVQFKADQVVTKRKQVTSSTK